MLYRLLCLRLRASDVELSLQSFCACHMRVCVSYDTSFTNSRTVYYDCNQIFVRNAFFYFILRVVCQVTFLSDWHAARVIVSAFFMITQ